MQFLYKEPYSRTIWSKCTEFYNLLCISGSILEILNYILPSKNACFVYFCTYPIIISECDLVMSVYAYLWNLRYQPVN